MAFVHPIQKSFADFIAEFEKLKMENEKLKMENEKLKQFIQEPSNSIDVKFAKFHNLTFLYPRGFPGCVQSSFEDEYHSIIKKHIRENKHKYNDGDIIFIGSTYETRQEYGFATIKGIYFISGEYPQFLSGFYYRDVINDINKFWNEFVRLEYYNEEEIEEYKKEGKYEP
jgi:hypothetical protein